MIKKIWFRLRGFPKRTLPFVVDSQQPRHQYFNPLFPKERQVVPSERPRSNDYIVYLGIVIVFLLCILVATNYLPQFRLKNITYDGFRYIQRSELEKIVEETLLRKPFFIFRNNSFFTLSEDEIEKTISEAISDRFALGSVTATKIFPRSLHVRISERIPRFIWISGGLYFYIDPTGTITQTSTPEEANPDFPKIFDQNNIPVRVGGQILSEKLSQFILSLSEAFSQTTGIGLDHLAIPPLICKETQLIEKTVRRDEISYEQYNEIRGIQEKVQNGEMTIEESLQRLSELAITSENSPQDIPVDSVLSFTNQNAENVNAAQEFDTAHIQIVFEEILQEKPCILSDVAHDVVVKTSEGWEVYFTDLLPLEHQFFKLTTTLEAKLSETPRSLQYVDVRYGDNVYFQ